MGVAPREARRLALRLSEALAAMHANDDVHGELTPTQVELARGGQVRIVRDRAGDTAMNRLRYAAPEVARREDPAKASDVFALSLIIRELIEGVPARRSEGDQLAMEAVDGRVGAPHGLAPELMGLAALAASQHVETRPAASEFVAAFRQKRGFQGFSRQDVVILLIAAAAVAMLVVLLRTSVQDRDRSARQYEDARAAFEGFLGGIYPELDRVENVAPLAEAGARALSSMEAILKEERDEADRELFARTLLWNGEAQRLLENSANAESLFQRAADESRSLEDRSMATAIELRAEAALGELARERKDPTTSLGHYMNAQSIGQSRVEADPDDADTRLALARALLGLGDLTMSTGRNSANRARKIYGEARASLDHPSVADAPTNLGYGREVLEIRASIDKLESSLAWATGDKAGAIELLQSHVKAASALVEMDPGRPRRRWMLARGADSLAQTQRSVGQLAPAVESFRVAVEGWRLLRAMEPDQPNWRREWARSTRELATTLSMVGEWQEAATLQEVSLAELTEMRAQKLLPESAAVELGEQRLDAAEGLLAAGDLKRGRGQLALAKQVLRGYEPEERDEKRWTKAMARARVIDAELSLAEGRWRVAEETALDCIDQLQLLANDGNDSFVRIERARALLVSSAVRAMEGESEVASGARERALAIADELVAASPVQFAAQSLRARALFVLGRDAEAAVVLDDLDQAGYRGLELSAVRAATRVLRR